MVQERVMGAVLSCVRMSSKYLTLQAGTHVAAAGAAVWRPLAFSLCIYIYLYTRCFLTKVNMHIMCGETQNTKCKSHTQM